MKTTHLKFLLICLASLILLSGCWMFAMSENDENNDSRNNDKPIDVPVDTPIDATVDIKIWTVGDSITEASQGYRNGIWELMTDAGNKIDFIGTQNHATNVLSRCPDGDHDGYSGFTINRLKEEFEDTNNGKLVAVQSMTPDVLLIMLGTNDLGFWIKDNDAPVAKTNEMMSLVDQIFEWFDNMSIIVGTIPPMSDKTLNTGKNRAECSAEYRISLTDAVRQHRFYGTRLFLSDNYSALSVDDLYDGIHPDTTGHDKMAVVWINAIKEYLNVR